MGDYIQVYTTTEKREEAKAIARDVVEKRLAACAQVLGPIASTYWWKGMIEEAEEWMCVMKSRGDRYEKLEETIRQTHPYEEPEILAVPIEAGSQGYLNWMDRELSN